MKNICVDVQILEKKRSSPHIEVIRRFKWRHFDMWQWEEHQCKCHSALTLLFSVFPSKSITSVPCWCWPVPCQGPESTRWTWRWCPLTLWSTTRTTIRQAPPSDSPSTSGRTPFKEEELEGTQRARHRHKQGKRSCKTQVVDAVQPVTVMLN